MLIYDLPTQQAEVLARTVGNESNPGENEWGWANGVLYLGSPPASGKLLLCYSPGKILFHLDTYTLSGRKQFILTSDFENDRTKIETIYVKLEPGFGVVTLRASVLSQGYVVSPDEEFYLSEDGINWVSEIVLKNNSANQAKVYKIYAKLTVRKTTKSGTFNSVTIIARTKGLKSTFPSPNGLSLITSFSLQSGAASVLGVWPEDDGTITIETTLGAINVDFYERMLRPTRRKFTTAIRVWEVDPIHLLEVRNNLTQIGNRFRYKNFPYLLDGYYFYDETNNVILGRVGSTDALIFVDSGEIKLSPSGQFVCISNNHLVTTAGVYTYPALEQVSTTGFQYSVRNSTRALGEWTITGRDETSSKYYRVSYNPATRSITSSYITWADLFGVEGSGVPIISMFPDKSYFLISNSASGSLSLYNSSNFSTVFSISAGTELYPCLNIDCTYLVAIGRNGTVRIYRVT
ncbi:MAG: hypothetical protein QXE80_03385 [Pyrobaculum sp.]